MYSQSRATERETERELTAPPLSSRSSAPAEILGACGQPQFSHVVDGSTGLDDAQLAVDDGVGGRQIALRPPLLGVRRAAARMRKVHSEDFSRRRRRLRPLHKTPRADRALSTPPSPSALSSSLPEVPRSLVRTLLAGDTEVLPFDAVRAPGEWALDAAQLRRAAVEALLLCLPDGPHSARAPLRPRGRRAPPRARVPPRRRPRPRRRAAVAHAAGDSPRAILRAQFVKCNSPRAILRNSLTPSVAHAAARRTRAAVGAAAVPALPPLPAAPQAALGLRLRRHLRRLHRAPARHPLQRPRRRALPARRGRGRRLVPVVGRRRHRRPASPAVRAGARPRALVPRVRHRRRRHARTQRGSDVLGGEPLGGEPPRARRLQLPAAVVDGMGSRSIGGGGRVPSSSTLASLDSSTDGGEMAALMEDETKAEEAAEAAAAEAEAAKQWNVDHAAALQELNRAVWAAYAHLADAGDPQHSAALQHVLPLPFALGARLYSLLLLATFGRDGVPLPSTDGVVALLRFVKAPLSLSPVQSHLIAFAEATFVTHRRHPRVVDLAAALLHRVKAAADTLPRMSYAEAALFHASARAMREHFRQQLSNLHAAFAEAPPALLQVRPPPLPSRTPHPPQTSHPAPPAPPAALQHLLDTYVHLYSLHTTLEEERRAHLTVDRRLQAEAAAAAEIAARTAAAAVAATEGAPAVEPAYTTSLVSAPTVSGPSMRAAESAYSSTDRETDSASVSRTAASVDVPPTRRRRRRRRRRHRRRHQRRRRRRWRRRRPRRRTAIVLRARACSRCDWIRRTRCNAALRASATARPRARRRRRATRRRRWAGRRRWRRRECHRRPHPPPRPPARRPRRRPRRRSIRRTRRASRRHSSNASPPAVERTHRSRRI